MKSSVCMWGLTAGAGLGLGEYIAKRLYADKYGVVGVVRNINKVKLNIPVIECDSSGVVDVDTYNQLLLENKVTAIVSFIGFGENSLFIDMKEKQIEKMIQANLLVPMNILRQSIPYVVQSNAQMVFATSIVAVKPEEGNPVYSATKMGLRGLVESLRSEMRAVNLKISMLHFNSVQKIGVDCVYDSLKMLVDNKVQGDVILY